MVTDLHLFNTILETGGGPSFGGGRKWFMRIADGRSDAEPASSRFDSNIGIDLILDAALGDNWFELRLDG